MATGTESTQDALARSLAFNVFGRVTNLIMAFASSVLLARLLGPADRGLLALMLSVSTVALAIGAVGQPLAVTYYASRRDEKPGAILGNTVIHALVLTLVVLPPTVLLYHPIADALSRGDGGRVWIVAAALVPITFLDWTISNQLLGMLRFGLYNGLKFMATLAYTVAIVVLMSGLHLGVVGGLIATGIGSIVTVAGCLPPILKRGRPAVDRRLLGRMLNYGSRVQVGVIFQMVNYRLDVIIMQFFRPLRQIGLYVAAQTVAEYVITLATAFQSSLLPLVSSLEGDERQRSVTAQSIRHYTLLAGLAAVANGAFGTFVILIAYGSAFHAALVPMLVLLPGVWLLGIGLVVQSDLGGRGRPGLSSNLAALAAGVTVALDFALIPGLGVMGGAIASVVAYSTFGITSVVALSRVSGIPVRELVVPTRRDLAVYPMLARRVIARVRRGGLHGSPKATRFTDRHPDLVFTGVSVLAILALSPLITRPLYIVALVALVAGAWIAWKSVAVPLALGGIPPLVDAIFGSDPLPKGGFTFLFAAWIALAVAFAVIQGRHREIKVQFMSLPVLGSIALLGLMILRLGSSLDPAYGSTKVQLYVADVIVFFIGALFVGSRQRDLRLLLRVMFGLTLAGAVLLLFNLVTGSAHQVIGGRFALSSQEYPIDLGRASSDGLLIGLFFLLSAESSRTRLRIALVVPILAVAMIAAGSRGPVLAFTIGLLTLIGLAATNPTIRRRLGLLAAVFALIAIVVPFVVPSSSLGRALSTIVGSASGLSSNGRSDLYTVALSQVNSHPLFGLGTGGFAALGTGLAYPHNIVLEMATDLGVVGVVVLLAVLTSMANRLSRLWRSAVGTDRLLTMILIALFLTAVTNACFSEPIQGNGEVWLWGGLAIGMSARLSERPVRGRIYTAATLDPAA